MSDVAAIGAPTPAAPAPAPPQPMPAWKAALYMLSSVALFVTQGLGMNLALANLTQLQGTLAATSAESAWLSAAYMAPSASLAVLLVKIRTQYGLRNFAEVSIIFFAIASVMNVFVSDLQSALVVRFLSGIAAAPLSTLGFLYMLEVFEPARKMTIGISLALMNTTLSAPLSRLVSPTLLDFGQWHGLYMLELALALMVFPIIYLLPLTPVPRAKVITVTDIGSYMLIALGFGALAVVLSLGRVYWWFEAPWLGWLLAVSIASLSLAAAIELCRDNPLIDIRWLASRGLVHFTGVLLVFRLIASAQSSVPSLWQQTLNLQYDQTMTLYAIILGASIFGGVTCAALMKNGFDSSIHVVALAMMAAGCFLDSSITNLTRPEQLYLGQGLIALGAALFLPPAMASGFKAALARGPNYFVSFIVVFLFTQSIGGLMGSAFYGSLVTLREKFHSNMLAEHVVMSDPLVAQRVAQLSGAYGKVIGDAALLKSEGISLLAQQISRESYMLAYGDAFLAGGVLASLALAALLVHLSLQALHRRFAAPQAASTAS